MEQSISASTGSCLVVERRQNQSFCQCNSFLLAQSKVITLQRKIVLPLTIWSLTPPSSTEAQEEFSQPLASLCCVPAEPQFVPS